MQRQENDAREGYQDLPEDPGSYVLVLNTTLGGPLVIGKLGMMPVGTGYHLYVGSAFGPGGLKARLKHHLKITDKPHWHIDYLRQRVDVLEIIYSFGPSRFEHEWANRLANTPNIVEPLKGFGSSDCGCRSHLFYAQQRPNLSALLSQKTSLDDNHGTIIHRVLARPTTLNRREI